MSVPLRPCDTVTLLVGNRDAEWYFVLYEVECRTEMLCTHKMFAKTLNSLIACNTFSMVTSLNDVLIRLLVQL